MLKLKENRSSGEASPSLELQLFIREMFGPDKVEKTPTKDLRNHVAWVPSHPNEEPPF